MASYCPLSHKIVLYTEYNTFFKTTFFPTHYSPNFTFSDPLSSVSGIPAYISNISLIAGVLKTRWTLSTTFNPLPWRPRLVFTGISVYSLDGEGRLKGQVDYWDSLNFKGGEYKGKTRAEGVGELVRMMGGGRGYVGREVPYVTLMRTSGYEVRDYPWDMEVLGVAYERRDEAYERLGRMWGE
ncbi:hypothetical protein TrRE_jg7325, partial [Triparma retinervis]